MFNLFKKKKEEVKTQFVFTTESEGGSQRNSSTVTLVFGAAGAILRIKPGQFFDCDSLTLREKNNVDHIVFVLPFCRFLSWVSVKR